MPLFPGRHKYQGAEHNWVQQHSLGLTLAALLLVQTLYAIWSGAYVFSREQPLGDGIQTMTWEFWAWWSWEYNISLVADTFGVFLIVMLSKWLYEQDSAESENNGDAGSGGDHAASQEPAGAHA